MNPRAPDPAAEALGRWSDRIVNQILHSDLEWVDVAIQMEQMRDYCREHAPDKLDAFEAIYESRFRRIWEQWRAQTNEDEL